MKGLELPLVLICIILTGVSHDPDWTRGKMSLRDCFTKAYDVNVTGMYSTDTEIQ